MHRQRGLGRDIRRDVHRRRRHHHRRHQLWRVDSPGQSHNWRLHLADRPTLRGDGHARAGQRQRAATGTYSCPKSGGSPGAYLIDASTGAILTTLPTGTSRVFAQPIFAQDTLFVATETNGLYDFAP